MKIVDKNEVTGIVKNKSRKSQTDKFLKEDLERYYIDEKKSLAEISRIYECDWSTVKNKLKKYEIPIRPHGAFSMDGDDKTSISKYNKGEISWSKYRSEQAKKNGFKDINEYDRKMRHERGEGTGLSMSENKQSSSYLGVYICENKKFLSKIVNIIESMPNGNPGYDIVCVKDKKIDVKCACLNNINKWNFNIRKNEVADYFLMIAFDDRENLNVQYIWLVKGDSVIEKTTWNSDEFIVNKKDIIGINKGNRSLKRWIKHEITDAYKLEEVQKVCDIFKNNNIIN